jgi:hypothetical protein
MFRERVVFIWLSVLYDLLDEQRIPRYALHCSVVCFCARESNSMHA